MDDNPFFIFNLEDFRKNHVRTLGKFTKNDFDIEKIVDEAGHLKLQGQVRAALAREFEDPSDDFVKLIASRVHDGRVTSNIKDSLKSIIVASLNAVIVDRVHDRLNSALNASNPSDFDESHESPSEIETTQDEIDGFNIVRAIAGRKVDPSRIVMRDAKSYCAILLDDNNRKTIARMHFNSASVRYFGTFVDKSEAKHPVSDPIAIYQFEQEILARISELGG